MKKPFIILSIASGLFLTSCFAVHSPSISATQPIRNAEIVGVAQGQAKALYILGIGGHNHSQIGFEAKKDLILKNKLAKNESFANYNLDVKTSHFIVFSKSTVTLTADIIRFTDTIPNSPVSIKYLNEISKIKTPILDKNGNLHLAKWTAINFGINESGYIDRFIGNDSLNVMIIKNTGYVEYKKISVNDVKK